MSGLKGLIAMQAAAKAKTPPEGRQQTVQESSQPEPTAQAPAKPIGGVKLGGLNLFKGTALAPPPKPAPPPLTQTPVSELPLEFNLEDLAQFDSGSVNESRTPSGLSSFVDEIEATAPDRELPADMTLQMQTFIESLDNVYPVLHDPDMLGQAVRMVMIELQDNPEYIKLVSDHDVHTMIRGMRNTMGMARVRKQEKTRKAGTGTRKNAQAKSKLTDQDMKLLDSLGGDWGDE